MSGRRSSETKHTFPHEVELHAIGEGDEANQSAPVTWDLVQLGQQGITHHLKTQTTNALIPSVKCFYEGKGSLFSYLYWIKHISLTYLNGLSTCPILFAFINPFPLDHPSLHNHYT